MDKHEDGFDPIETARSIESSYRGYISSTIHFSNDVLQSQLEEILNEPGYLAKGPFLEAAPPYLGAETPRELVASGEFCQSVLELGGGDPERFDPDRSLYKHQVRAIRLARAERNYIVTTGTGSGKTECFLLPILDDILREFEVSGPQDGVRALILYPMNALANDQLKRLRELLEGVPITFGRYTGDTENGQSDAEVKWREENPGTDRLPNELISREVMRRTPPNILLTNYSMLEYLLLRPEDSPFFSGAFGKSWRHIAIDEAHMYSGSLGTEIAYLLRRLKARIVAGSREPLHLHCYATSATMGSEDDIDKVAKFAADLFGEPFGPGEVVVGTKDSAAKDIRPTWGSLPLEVWGELREVLNDSGEVRRLVEDIIRPLVPSDEYALLLGASSYKVGLGTVLLGEDSTEKLVRSMGERLLDLTPWREGKVMESLGIEGLDSRTLSDMVEVLSVAQRTDGIPILSSRYHSFLRGPEGLFLNLHTYRLVHEKLVSASIDGIDGPVPIYEIAACRHCGEAFLLGQEEPNEGRGCSWLNPKPVGDSFVEAERFDPRLYYRLLRDEDEPVESERLLWICPTCGSLHDSPSGGGHSFDHPQIGRIPIAQGSADEENSKCPHCGYSSVNAIQPMRVSPEAVGSVVCYDLARRVPPFAPNDRSAERRSFGGLFGGHTGDRKTGTTRAGSVICFSDRRQDAAYFAPAMERTYNDLTIRQILREAVDELYDGRHGVMPSDVCDWIVDEGARRYGSLFANSSRRSVAKAWVLGELMTDSPRNSLEALGIVRAEPFLFLERLNEDGPSAAAQMIAGLESSLASWVTVDDYLLFVRYCLETLRRGGALKVPTGVHEHLKKRTRVAPSAVYPRVEGDAKGCISFIGRETGSENARSSFIRKTARAKYGIEVSRADSCSLLSSVHEFLVLFFIYLRNEYGYNFCEGNDDEVRQRFCLNMDLWQLFPGCDDDPVYLCDTCGCEYHWDARPSCPTYRCDGTLRRTTFAEARGKDAHYKKAYRDKPVPLRIEEHTAQLSSDRAAEIQSAFLKGEVNELSCTTTFELGVDVGDLRSVFMRNVPPKAANYTQRAGRVGRRAGKPGYAVTFARLRPHDLAYFKAPEQIISGSTPVPCCYLNNLPIAMRHVFAVVLSEYFRYLDGLGNRDASRVYHAFLDLSDERPDGVRDLKAWLDSRPREVYEQLSNVFPLGAPMRERLGVDTWGWVEELLGLPDGRLMRTHERKYDDFRRIAEAAERYRGEGRDSKAGSMYHILGGMKKQRTIGVLAENGVLPKYGFPTDIVELHVDELERAVERRRPLRLQRGLRQAIREYAPGSEVIADKCVWKSVGIRKPRGRSLEVRSYGKCPQCGAFAWPIDDYSDSVPCKVCHSEVPLKRRMLIPSEGFEAILDSKKDPGDLRPRSRGSAKIEFCQSWEGELQEGELCYSGGRVVTRYASNGKLCAMNTAGSTGFLYCPYCGAAAPATGDGLEHKTWCIDKRATRYQALGAAFTSDVLEFRFLLSGKVITDGNDWESLSWALYASAVGLLEIPETEIGVTFYPNEVGSYSIMLYDNVPGGAGYALQLAEKTSEIVREAYNLVANCTCGEDTCCYSCLCNYYNQGRQNILSRGAALKILGALGAGGGAS